jgi:acyl-CoA reductase-like NAD-dependent aldehyde dehydrogenase
MEINRTGAGKIPPGTTERTGQAGGARFSERAAEVLNAATGAESAAAPAITRAELQDPEKVKAILDRHVSELVDRASLETGRELSEADRTAMMDWISTDPVFRGKLMRYLEQVAK